MLNHDEFDSDLATLAGATAATLAARPGLTGRERGLLTVAADVANQTLGRPFADHVGRALDAGATTAELREVILHLAIYVSFPKALQAVAALNRLGRAAGAEASAPCGEATNTGTVLTSGKAPGVLAAIDPEFAALALAAAGQVWQRPLLSQRDRAFICLAANVCNQTLGEPFALHVDMALRAGATPAELREVMIQMAYGASFPKALQAMAALAAQLQVQGGAA